MGFPRDLEEYTEQELTQELHRRRNLLAAGKCDYCGRLGSTEPCRFPHRHRVALHYLESLQSLGVDAASLD